MSCPALLRPILALCALILVVGCAEVPPSTTAVPTPTPAGYWNGDGVPGSPKIVVSISEQHAYFYKGKHLVGESTVSTGKPGFGTPPGAYTVVSKDKDHVSTVFGDYVDDFGNVVKSNIDSRKDSKPKGSHYDGARMPYAMFFRGGYAMHQGYVPPYAASHGCIRLPAGMAQPFFDNAPVGTPVIVRQEAEKHPIVAPALNPLPVPASLSAPTMVRTNAPASVRPAIVRNTIPASTPVPLRSPAALPSTVPAPTPVALRPSSVPVRSASPAPLRSPAPVVSRTTAAVRSPVPGPVRSPSPAPLRSPAPVLKPTPAPVRSPAPGPVRSPAPVITYGQTPIPMNTPAPASVHPTPTPVRSRPSRHARHRIHSRAPVPSPTPAPSPAR
jgi:L,D-transpeptidase catalytic domain